MHRPKGVSIHILPAFFAALVTVSSQGSMIASPNLEKAEGLIRENKASEAVKVLKELKPLERERARFFFLQGRALQDLRRNTEALQSYSVSIFLDGANAKSFINRGLVKGALKDLNGAMDDLNHALELNPRSKEAYLNRGVTNAGLNKINNSIYDFTQSILLDQEYADAYRNRGLTYSFLGKRDQACRDWARAVELGQAEVQSWINETCQKPNKTKLPHSKPKVR